ncbi:MULTISPECIES: type II toxin-antitoxin system antitoxin SocA domain-containing protein [unclassified Mammaliicoccus]|uniref:Panacea domain-containing protein n=1 Tax=unclassified Mammaliicoccus TaxID=2803851 RepID=UPI001EFB3D30|nr:MULTISPECIES: type II toxin-antitoxin system antitoxin SocA domain-containing protein [unclassified Mammaliicoccus]
MEKYNVTEIAKWFYENNNKVTEFSYDGNLMLQKLLYFADVYNFVNKNSNLYHQKPIGFANGPVYNLTFWDYSKNNLKETIATDRDIDNDTLKILKIVNFIYGNYSSKTLSDITHEQSPWRNKEEDCIKSYYNPTLELSDLTAEEITDLKDVFELYNDMEIDNLKVDKIGDNVIIYDKTLLLNELDYSILENLPKEEDSIFIEKIDGDLVYG